MSSVNGIYRVIHKSVKHFKNLQQMDYAADRGNSYADRERNSPSLFLGKARAHSCPDLPLGDSSSKYGRPRHAGTRVEQDGLSHRRLPYYQRWTH
jgi:hypothetical protein